MSCENSHLEYRGSKYTQRLQGIRIPTIKNLDRCVEECKTDFETTIAKYNGVLFEEGDENDAVSSDIQGQLSESAYDEVAKPSALKKFVGNIPLPRFLPSVRKRTNIIIKLDTVENYVQLSTSTRQNYENVCTFAFGPELSLQSLRNGKDDSGWTWKAKLFPTADQNRTWMLLKWSKKGFDEWWSKHRTKPEVSECCADLKALCKAIVFVSDDIGFENLDKLSCADKLRTLVGHCQEIAFMLVEQMSLHPEYAKRISKEFGFVIPIIYALSIVTKKAKEITGEPAGRVKIQEMHLSEQLAELEFIVTNAKEDITRYGASLVYYLFAAAAAEENIEQPQDYIGRPTAAQLFNLAPEELPRKYVDIVMDSGLTKDEESLRNNMDRIRSDKIRLVAQQIAQDCEIQEDGITSSFDVTELEEIGIGKIHVSELPVSLVGSGATSTVSLHTSSRNSSRSYAVKYSKKNNKDAWKRLKREAKIWKNLNHSNILPLLGYCMIPRQESNGRQEQILPSLVTPYCSGGCLDDYLREHKRSLTYRDKMEFLCDIISALSYLHSRSICHGDLRAANVLVDKTPEGPRVMICDFGMSDFFLEVAYRLQKPTADQILNDKWVAPELLFTKPGIVSRVNDKGDIFAFGCVILEVAFDKKPYHSWPDHEIIDARKRLELPAVQSDMDEFYWDIAKDCWNSQPLCRPVANDIVSRFSERLYSEAL